MSLPPTEKISFFKKLCAGFVSFCGAVVVGWRMVRVGLVGLHDFAKRQYELERKQIEDVAQILRNQAEISTLMNSVLSLNDQISTLRTQNGNQEVRIKSLEKERDDLKALLLKALSIVKEDERQAFEELLKANGIQLLPGE